MMGVMLESAVRIIVLAAIVAAGLRILRTSPRLAHHAWAGVCAIMLALPAIVAWAPEAGVPVLPSPRVVASALSAPSSTTAVVQPGSADVTPAATPTRAGAPWRLVAGAVYGTGVVLLLTGLGVGWWHARSMIRQATRIGGRLTHPRCVTPITAGLWSPVVILPPDWQEWHRSDLAAVLAHEEEHVKRRDPLVAFLGLMNRAVFWFHPLAWWLQREIAALSEQACDAVVLSRGHDGERYAAALLRFARLAASARGRIAPAGTAMPGAGLGRRLGLLQTTLPQSTRHTGWFAAAYLIAVVLCAGTTPTRAHTQAAAAIRADAWQSSTSDHFEIFSTSEQQDRVAAITQEAEAAYMHVTRLLRYDLTTKVPLILVARRVATDDVLVQSLLSRSGTPVRPSIIVSLDDTRSNAIVHQLTQTFTVEIVPNINRTAPWLMDGLAEHVRGLWDPMNVVRVRQAVQSNSIPTITAMKDTHWGHALFDFIVERSKEDGLRRFLLAVRRQSDVAAAVQTAFDTSPDAFSEDFAGYVTRRFGTR